MPSNREARALKKELPPLLPKDTSELAVSKAFNLESLGTLSILPRELRDEIYSHMCNQTCPYRFVEPACWLTGLKWDGKGRSMLEVSKAVRKEFLTVLYSKGVFEMDQHSVLPYTQRSDIPFFNDISNIQSSLDLADILYEAELLLESDSGELPNYLNMRGRPFSYFTGTSIMRNKYIITLHGCSFSLLLPLESQEFYAIFQLTGFKTVQLRFRTDADDWLKPETPPHIRQEFYKLGTCPGFETMVLQTSTALERTLGSFTVTRGYVKRSDLYRYWVQHVTFHPQGRPMKKMDSLEANSSTEIEEVTSAFDFLTWTRKYH